jgi:hypothetical protein
MKTSGPHGMRNAVLVALFLLVGGTLTYLYMDESVSPNGMIHFAMVKGSRRDTHTINRMKYIVWHELYNYRRLNDVPKDESWKNMQYWKRYRWAEKGVEEFAYIGQEILSSGSSSESYIETGQWTDKDWGNKRTRLLEVSPEVIAVFRGVFNPKLTRQQKPDRAIDG